MPAVLHYRELLLELTKREIKQRYKQSVLGYAWVILNPLIQMLVMAFVFSHVLRLTGIGVPYPIYLYAGLLPWTLFSNTLLASVNSLVSNAGLLTKVYFPRVVFVQSTVLAKVIDFVLASSIFVVFMLYYRVPVTWHVLWLIPLFLVQLLFTYAISLLAAAINLFYRDMQYVLGLGIIVWMYLTPVIYPVEIFPEQYRWIFQINPLAILINGYRQILFGGSSPNLLSLGIALILSALLYVIARATFKKLEGVFADVV